MAVLNDALNPIKALAKQAHSYSGSVARAGIRTAQVITKDALGHGMKYYALGGAVAGGALGGYDDYSSGGNGIRGFLKGATYGAAGGAALRLGMSASGARGMRSMRAFGMRARGGVGGGMSGAAARAAGSTNYFRAMTGDFERAGGFTAMRGGARNIYARGAGLVNLAGATRAGGAIAGAAGKAYGTAQGLMYNPGYFNSDIKRAGSAIAGYGRRVGKYIGETRAVSAVRNAISEAAAK